MQPQSEQQQDTGKYKIQVLKKMKTSINMDCIKNCPMDRSVWALAFYQQNPQFLGGIMVINSHNLMLLDNIDSTNHVRYQQLGPIMHIQWLIVGYQQQKQHQPNNYQKYYILAAARCDQAIICSYSPKQSTITLQKRILLQKGTFCLYCDWKSSTKTTQYPIIASAIVSTSQSSVFSFIIKIESNNIQIGQIYEYKKHQYAVWACRINPDISVRSLMIVGDEVDCLYLYDLTKKQLIGKNKKAHTQGICEITWKDNKNILTGSFDGSFAEISIDNFGEILRRFQLGGTIWRIIPIKQKSKQVNSMLICNSSQKKFQIYNTKNKTITWDSDTEHTSLAYAADHNGQIIITASFYDQSVRIWKIYPHST